MAGNANLKCLCLESSENFTMASLVQFFAKVRETSEEVRQLVAYIRALEFKQVVIYVSNPIRCGALAHVLNEVGFRTTFIHELMPHKIRLARLVMFKEMKMNHRILVTSCCGHAMEFKNADVTIMFDEAGSVDEYTHRISSRRARKGLVISFIRTDADLAVLRQIEKLHHVSIKPLPAEMYTSAYVQIENERETP